MPREELQDGTAQSDARTQHTTYLTSLRCGPCEAVTTYAYSGPKVPVDQEEPWPDVNICPKCSQPYPDDLAHVIVQVSELPHPADVIDGVQDS